jgi:flagellar hook assembly protein FlgD
VRVLADAPLDAGPHAAWWDGRNEGGREAPSGTYFYQLEAGSFSEIRALVKLR